MFSSKVCHSKKTKMSKELKFILLVDLLQQTLDLHPNSNIIHIGCDEVVLTNSHPECRESMMDTSQRYIE